MDAYEYIRLNKHHQEFTLYQDPDVLKQNIVYPINDDALGNLTWTLNTQHMLTRYIIEFDSDAEGVDQDSELSDDLDFSNIPFSDHTFDVDQFIQCN